MNRLASLRRSAPRRVLRVETLENRHLLSGLGFDWLAAAGQSFCGPLLEKLQSLPACHSAPTQPGSPGATAATWALLTDGSGNLWSYNAAQGYGASAQKLGPTGVSMQDLAFDGSSAYYGVDNASPNHDSTSALYGIGFSTLPPGNVTAEQKSLLYSTSDDPVNLNGLGYADGALWATGSVGVVGDATYLFKIDTTDFAITEQYPLETGSGTSTTGFAAAGDIEFVGTTGYITTTSGELLTFSASNPGTFQAEDIRDGNNQPIKDIQGLTFASYLLLAFRQGSNDVYRLNTATNQWAQYGTLGSAFGVGLLGATAAAGTVTSITAVPPPAAEVAVCGGGQFGIALQGLPSIQRTFVVSNEGNEPLVTGPITLPDGFEIVEGLDSVIPVDGRDTFTVRMNTDTPGTFDGDLLIPTNDGDGGDGIEDPVAISLHGTVVGLHRDYSVSLRNALTAAHRQVESIADRLAGWRARVDTVFSRWDR